METILKLKNGNIKFAVHGVFGEGASSVYNDGKPSKAMAKRITQAGGCEMLRLFNTPAECEAYRKGIEDMDGWLGYAYTSKEEHAKIFGWGGAKVVKSLPDKKPAKNNTKTVDTSDLVMLTMYHTQSNPERTGYIADIDELIKMATDFNKKFGNTNWEDSDEPWDDCLAIFYNKNKLPNWNTIEMIERDEDNNTYSD